MKSKIPLDWDIRNAALNLGMTRSRSMGHRDTRNSKNMIHNRPNWWKHYVGALGEIIFSRYSGLAVDNTTIGRGDDGSDFPGGIQVKTSDCGTVPNLMIPKSLWERKRAKLYVLIWIQDQEFAHILGAITHEDFDRLKELKNFGRGPTYVIARELLKPVSEFLGSEFRVASSALKSFLPAVQGDIEAQSNRNVNTPRSGTQTVVRAAIPDSHC